MDLISRVGIRIFIYIVDRKTVIYADKFLPQYTISVFIFLKVRYVNQVLISLSCQTSSCIFSLYQPG